MTNAVGRPRELAVVKTQKKKMPKKETEMMRQMRAAYLSMGASRSYRKIAERFGYTMDWVAGIARAFKWQEDAKLRDGAIQNAFMEENRRQVTDAQRLLFASLMQDIEREAVLRGIRIGENGEVEVLDGDNLKSYLELKKGLLQGGMRVKDYKAMNDLLLAFRKVVYEWNPTDDKTQGGMVGGPLSGARVSGDLNVQLIIEK